MNQIYKAPERINATNAEEMSREWVKALNYGQDLIIDLSNTKVITGDGYKSILMTLKIASIKKLDFCVCNPNQDIKKVLIGFGLANIIAPFTYNNNENRSR